MRPAPAPLSPRSARTLYNVADALFPPAFGGGLGGGDVDVAPAVERQLRGQGVGAARRCWALLAGIEWQPVVTLRARTGFSRLPRARRQTLLATWERSRIPARRRALAELRGWLEEALAEAQAGSPGASHSPG